jgi:spermidine synthase
MDVTQPYKHVLEYTANMIMGLAYVDDPKKALMIGLGGGAVTKYVQKYYPDLEITNVELDDVIVRVAKDFFNFVEVPKNKTVVMDGRRFLTRSPEKYDLIFLDAYYGAYIPFHLLTAEFLQLVKNRLTDSGVVVSNTWRSQKLYRSESATYATVFKYFDSYLGTTSNNRIIIANRSGRRFTLKDLHRRMAATQRKRQFKDINLTEMFEITYDRNLSWPEGTQILTDDHAPVNLLVDPRKR